jgi:hypothetical protein
MRKLRVLCVRDGRSTELDEDLDAIDIVTRIGVIHIDLGEQVPDMVLMRSSEHGGGPGRTRLILSPMGSGRLAVGVIEA